jgi:CheY-like chemotaxis protein
MKSVFGLIAPQLPYLRRFARALAGSQRGGDAYAVATLEAMALEPDLPGEAEEVRIALFQTFLKVWRAMPNGTASDDRVGGSAVTDAADRHLRAITPTARVAFLLHAQEEFSIPHIARILERPVAEVNELLEQAAAEVAEQLRTKVLIIEDETVIAMELEVMMTDLGHHVIAVARTRAEAVAAVADEPPGLVLADIRLADGSSGVDAVDDILGAYQAPVVYITAHPEALLTGDRPEPAFLITKPYQPRAVMAVVSQALFFNPASASAKAPAL